MAKKIHPTQYLTIFGIILNGLHSGTADVHPKSLVNSVDPAMLNATLNRLAAGDFSKILIIPRLKANEIDSAMQKVIDLQNRKLQREFDNICANVTRFGPKFLATVESAKKAGDQFLEHFEDTTTAFMDAFDKSRSLYLKKANKELKKRMADVDDEATKAPIDDHSNDWLYGETSDCTHCNWTDYERCHPQIEEIVGERWVDKFWNYWNTSCGECNDDANGDECLKAFRKENCETTTDDNQLIEDCRVFPMGKIGGPISKVTSLQEELKSAAEQEDDEESNLFIGFPRKYIERVKEHLQIVRNVRKYSRRIFIILERGIWLKSFAKNTSLEEKFLFKLGGFGNVDHTPMYRLLLLRFVIKSGMYANLSVDKLVQD